MQNFYANDQFLPQKSTNSMQTILMDLAIYRELVKN